MWERDCVQLFPLSKPEKLPKENFSIHFFNNLGFILAEYMTMNRCSIIVNVYFDIILNISTIGESQSLRENLGTVFYLPFILHSTRLLYFSLC